MISVENLFTAGLIRLAHYDLGKLDPRLPVVDGKNLRTEQSNDILARAIAGIPRYVVNGVYLEYENTAGAPAPVSFDKTTTAADFQGLGGSKDYIRANLTASATFGSSGSPYGENRATFFALALNNVGPTNQGMGGLDFSAAANSKIVSIGLVAMPDIEDETQDLLYARYAPASPFAKAADREVGITWTLQFETP